MEKSPYVRLIERMNLNVVKHAPTPAMLELMNTLFTKDQAGLIGDFPLGAYTATALATTLDRDEDELAGMLAQMSKDGLIFEAKIDDGQGEYSVLPFEPGFMEMQLLKGNEDERTKKFAVLARQASMQEAELMKEVLQDPEMAKQLFSPPLSRIIAIEQEVEGDKEIASTERVSQIVESETSYAAGECGCRHIAKLSGNPCKSGSPSKCCIWFGKTADYLVERGYADRLTQKEVCQLLKKCEDAGTVHFTGNTNSKENVVLCNCCDCCCVYLKKHKALRDMGYPVTETSNFVARVDMDTCIGCGECVDFCHYDALEMSDDTLSINSSYCLGCGVCVSKCPTQSLALVRISHKKPPELERSFEGPGV